MYLHHLEQASDVQPKGNLTRGLQRGRREARNQSVVHARQARPNVLGVDSGLVFTEMRGRRNGINRWGSQGDVRGSTEESVRKKQANPVEVSPITSDCMKSCRRQHLFLQPDSFILILFRVDCSGEHRNGFTRTGSTAQHHDHVILP